VKLSVVRENLLRSFFALDRTIVKIESCVSKMLWVESHCSFDNNKMTDLTHTRQSATIINKDTKETKLPPR